MIVAIRWEPVSLGLQALFLVNTNAGRKCCGGFSARRNTVLSQGGSVNAPTSPIAVKSFSVALALSTVKEVFSLP